MRQRHIKRQTADETRQKFYGANAGRVYLAREAVFFFAGTGFFAGVFDAAFAGADFFAGAFAEDFFAAGAGDFAGASGLTCCADGLL